MQTEETEPKPPRDPQRDRDRRLPRKARNRLGAHDFCKDAKFDGVSREQRRRMALVEAGLAFPESAPETSEPTLGGPPEASATTQSDGDGSPAAPAPRPRLHLDRRAASLAERVAAAPADTLLDRLQLGAWLGVAPKTIARWDRQGLGPRSVRAGLRAIRYLKADVLLWLEQRASAPAAER
jgi:predicted DNA-binding transcriptional regulator AlpA